MIYVISKSTFGSYNVRDIQCNANWYCCPYPDYALIPDNLIDGILATKGYCDITLNSEGTEVTGFTARTIPSVPKECCGDNTVLSVNNVKAGTNGDVVLTPADVGAAPAGYGLGSDTMYGDHWTIYGMDALNATTKTGFYAFYDDSKTLGGSVAWTAIVEGYIPSRVQQTLKQCGSLLTFRRVMWDGVWSDWVDCSPSAFVPSNPVLVSDCNTAIKSGWYTVSSTTSNTVTNRGGWMRVDAYSDKYVHQAMYYEDGIGFSVERYQINGVWKPWEWVNPMLLQTSATAMTPSMEYRTTKRYKGRAVYCRMIPCGWLAAGSHSVAMKDVPETSTCTGLEVRLWNNGHERIDQNPAGCSKTWIGRTDGFLTLNFVLSVNHGNVEAYVEYTK